MSIPKCANQTQSKNDSEHGQKDSCHLWYSHPDTETVNMVQDKVLHWLVNDLKPKGFKSLQQVMDFVDMKVAENIAMCCGKKEANFRKDACVEPTRKLGARRMLKQRKSMKNQQTKKRADDS